MKNFLKLLMITLLSPILINCDDNEYISEDIIPIFEISGVPFNSNGYTKSDNIINCEFSFDPVYNSIDQTFQIRFETDGQATLNGNQKNTWFDLIYDKNNGKEFDLVYVPTSIGKHKVYIFIKNNFGVEKSFTVEFDVTNPSFLLSLEPSEFKGVQGKTMEAIFKIENNLSGNYEFEFKIDQIPNQTEIKYMSEKVQSGAWYTITNPSQFTLYFSTPMVGTFSYKVSVRNKLAQQEKLVNYVTSVQKFDFNVNNLDNVKVGEQKPITINLQTEYTSKYSVRFNKIDSNGNYEIVGINFNEWIEMSSISEQFMIKGISNSTVIDGAKLFVEVKDEYGNTATPQTKKFTIYNLPQVTRTTSREGVFTSEKRGYDMYLTKRESSFQVNGRPYNINNITVEYIEVTDFYKNQYPQAYANLNLNYNQQIVMVNDVKDFFNEPIRSPFYVGDKKSRVKVTVRDEKGNITEWYND